MARHLMDQVQGEPFGFDRPLFADEPVRREAFEGLQSSAEVIGADQVSQVISQLVVAVEAFDGRLLDRAVPLPGNGLPANRERDAFDLAIRPGVGRFGQAVLDLVCVADHVEAAFP